jgi:hypothetical protein
MSVANPLWGAPRIHGELLKLGIDIILGHREPSGFSECWSVFWPWSEVLSS